MWGGVSAAERRALLAARRMSLPVPLFAERVSVHVVAVALPEARAITVEQGEDVRTLQVDYHGGPRFPHLVRDEARADLLKAILAPRNTAQ